MRRIARRQAAPDRAVVAVGKPGAETPLGRDFYVQGRYVSDDPFFGPFVLVTSAYSRLSDWPGGGLAGIHGTNQPEAARPGGLARLRAGLECGRRRTLRATRPARHAGRSPAVAAQPGDGRPGSSRRGRRGRSDSRDRDCGERRMRVRKRTMPRRAGVSAKRAIAAAVRSRAAGSPRHPTARTVRPLSGFPKRLRAVASTIEVLPARERPRRGTSSVLHAIERPAALAAFDAAPSERRGDANERRGGVVEVVRLLLLGADADDVQHPSDLGRAS